MFQAPSHRLLLVLAAAGLASTAVPALAKADKGDQNTTTMRVEQRDGKTVYCVSDMLVGSHLPREVCKDRAGWARDGLVIPERQERAADSARQPAAPSAGGGQAAPIPSAPKAP